MWKITLKDGTVMVVQSYTIAKAALDYRASEKAAELAVKAHSDFSKVETFVQEVAK